MLRNFMDAHLGLWGKCCTHQFLCRSRPRKMALSTKSSSGRRWERGCLWFGMQSGDGETKHESCWAWKPNPEVSQMSWCPFCFCRDGPINHLTSRRAYVLRLLPRQIACWATLWSHMAGFAHIRCSLDLQQLPMFQVGKYQARVNEDGMGWSS